MKPWELQGEEVVYTEDRWRLLRAKRRLALRAMRALEPLGSPVVTHGSIARGDVRPSSDVDVVVLEPRPPGLVVFHLERAGLQPRRYEIVQATPGYVPKVYIYLDDRGELVVSVPLAPLGPREREFYKWGGELDIRGVEEGRRVPGVNKKLRLIYPTEWGHVEMDIEGMEAAVARLLGVSIETVRERIRVLTRRRRVGHTGPFVRVEAPGDADIEEVIEEIARRNPFFRRRTGRL